MNKNLLKLIYLILVVTLFWLLNLSLHKDALIWGDSWDYAHVARNIANGEGPLDKTYGYEEFSKGLELPNFERSRRTLYIFTLAGFMTVFGANDLTLIITSGFFYFIVLVLTWFFSNYFLDKKYSWWVVSIIAFNPTLLYLSLSGRPETMFTCLFLLFLWVLIRGTDASQPYLRGLVYALLVLTRKLGFFFSPLLFWRPRKSGLFKWKNIFILFTIYITLIGLSHIIHPRPFTTLGQLISGTELYEQRYESGEILDKTIYENLKYATKHSYDIFKKWAKGISIYYRELPKLFNVWVLGFLLLGLAYRHPKADYAWQNLKQLFLFSFILAIIGIPLFNAKGGNRYFVYFLPIAMIIAMGGYKEIFMPMLSKYSIGIKRITYMFLLVMIFYPSVWNTVTLAEDRWIQNIPHSNFEKEFGKFVRENTDTNDIVFTNNPELIAWYGNCYTVLIPMKYNVFYELDEQLNPQYIAVTDYLESWDYTNTPEILTNLVNEVQIPENFYLFDRFSVEGLPNRIGRLYKKEIISKR